MFVHGLAAHRLLLLSWRWPEVADGAWRRIWGKDVLEHSVFRYCLTGWGPLKNVWQTKTGGT